MPREKNDSSAEHGGMRKAKMPSDHHEKKQNTNPVCGEKYSTEFGNPQSLDKMNEGLVGFVKKNKMKYE